MGLLNLPRIPRGASPEQMANIYNMAIEEMEYRLNGFLQSNNIQEIGGWRVSQTDLQAKDKDVGMSTADDSTDPVRLWAGGTDKNTAPWRVTQAGKEHSTGATIESAAGYPKIVLDPGGNFLGIYTDAQNYIRFIPSFTNGKPAFEFVSGSASVGDISAPDALEINAQNGLNLSSGTGPVYLSTQSIYGVQVDNWGEFKNKDTGHSLQTDLDAKAVKGAATSSYTQGDHNHGISPGIKLATTSDGTTVSGYVTWAASGGFTHSHTQS